MTENRSINLGKWSWSETNENIFWSFEISLRFERFYKFQFDINTVCIKLESSRTQKRIGPIFNKLQLKENKLLLFFKECVMIYINYYTINDYVNFTFSG